MPHCADEPSPPARIEHIPSRSITPFLVNGTI
jgi:hypothetical protein